MTQASYLGMAEEFRKLQSRCTAATSKMQAYKTKYEAAVAKTSSLELANLTLEGELDALRSGKGKWSS